jgi:hypothetical protein
VKIKEKGETKIAVSDAEVVQMEAQAVLLKDHCHSTALKSTLSTEELKRHTIYLISEFPVSTKEKEKTKIR